MRLRVSVKTCGGLMSMFCYSVQSEIELAAAKTPSVHKEIRAVQSTDFSADFSVNANVPPSPTSVDIRTMLLAVDVCTGYRSIHVENSSYGIVVHLNRPATRYAARSAARAATGACYQRCTVQSTTPLPIERTLSLTLV